MSRLYPTALMALGWTTQRAVVMGECWVCQRLSTGSLPHWCTGFSQPQQSAPDGAVASSASLITYFPKQLTWRAMANWVILQSWFALSGTKLIISPILWHLGRKRKWKSFPIGGSESSLRRTQSLKEFGLKRQRTWCSKRRREKLQEK